MLAREYESLRKLRRAIYPAAEETVESNTTPTFEKYVTIDATNEILPLAYTVVESENTSSWEYFIVHLGAAILQTHSVP